MFLETTPDLNRKKLITVPPRGAGGGSLVVRSVSEGQGGQPTPCHPHRPPFPTTALLPAPPPVAVGGPLCPQTGRWRRRVGQGDGQGPRSETEPGRAPPSVATRRPCETRQARVGLSTGHGTAGRGRHRAAQQAWVRQACLPCLTGPPFAGAELLAGLGPVRKEVGAADRPPDGSCLGLGQDCRPELPVCPSISVGSSAHVLGHGLQVRGL